MLTAWASCVRRGGSDGTWAGPGKVSYEKGFVAGCPFACVGHLLHCPSHRRGVEDIASQTQNHHAQHEGTQSDTFYPPSVLITRDTHVVAMWSRCVSA